MNKTPATTPKKDHVMHATFYEDGSIRFKCQTCPRAFFLYFVKGRRLFAMVTPGMVSARHVGGGVGFPLDNGLQIDFDKGEIQE